MNPSNFTYPPAPIGARPLADSMLSSSQGKIERSIAVNIQIMLKLLYTLEQLRKHETWSRSQLETYQAEALHELRQYAYERSPFYQKFHKGLTDRPLHELPVLTKAMMMENFDELVTDRTLHLEEIRAYASQGEAGQRYKNRYWVNATSGSTGHPGFFLFDESEWVSVLASFARSQEWSGIYQPHPSSAHGHGSFDQSLAYVVASVRDHEKLVAPL